MPRKRLDMLIVERGLTDSRNLAQRMIMAGEVYVNGQVVFKPSTRVEGNADIHLRAKPRFASRGGEKLQAALDAFQINVDEKVCADVGASTGGFTDCLLQNGAKRVYAIDVGRGILDWRLRQDARVVVMEGVNARYLDKLPEAMDLITIDASFISLKVLLPVILHWLPGSEDKLRDASGDIIALIKPQFEAGRKEATRHKGVIRDAAIHQRVLEEILNFAQSLKLVVRGLIRSPLRGPKGNVEFLTWLQPGSTTTQKKPMAEINKWIANVTSPEYYIPDKDRPSGIKEK